MQVIDGDLVHGSLMANLVRLAVAHATLDTATDHPIGVSVRIMITSGLAPLLRDRQSAKFAAPDDERLVEQSALGQISNQAGNRLVGFSGKLRMISLDVVMPVPTSLVLHAPTVNLNKAHTTLNHPSGCKALRGNVFTFVIVKAI